MVYSVAKKLLVWIAGGNNYNSLITQTSTMLKNTLEPDNKIYKYSIGLLFTIIFQEVSKVRAQDRN